MPDRWIDEALPEHEPSERFIAQLRTDLADQWRHGDSRLTMVSTAQSQHAPRAGRRLVLVSAGAAALVVGLLVVVARQRGEHVQLPTASTVPRSSVVTQPVSTSTVSAPETSVAPSTSSSTSTTIAVDGAIAPLVGHTWVRTPIAERFPSGEPWLRVEADGTQRGTDGCDELTVVLWEATSHRTFPPTDGPASLCAKGFTRPLDHATLSINDDAGVLRLVASGSSGSVTYVASDTLPLATVDAVVGSRQSAAGERFTFDSNGTTQIGPCEPAGRWTLDGEQLTITGFAASAETTRACAGGPGSVGMQQLVESLASGSTSFAARVDGDLLLLRAGSDGPAVWLRRVDPVEPALDLRRGTLYGFAPLTDINSEFIVEGMSRVTGPLTFDSGWYVTARHPLPPTEPEDCFGGLSMRVVQWGDVAVGFLRLDGKDRLWIMSIGDKSDFVAKTRLPVRLPATHGPAVTSPEGFGVGTPINELIDAGLMRTGSFTNDRGDVENDPNLATRATVESLRLVSLRLAGSKVTSILLENPGFC